FSYIQHRGISNTELTEHTEKTDRSSLCALRPLCWLSVRRDRNPRSAAIPSATVDRWRSLRRRRARPQTKRRRGPTPGGPSMTAVVLTEPYVGDEQRQRIGRCEVAISVLEARRQHHVVIELRQRSRGCRELHRIRIDDERRSDHDRRAAVSACGPSSAPRSPR